MKREPGPHTLRSVLRWASAPAEVLTWADAEKLGPREVVALAEDARGVLERAPSASLAIWPLAIMGFPLDRVATAMALVLDARATRHDEPRLLTAIELALGTVEDPGLGERALVQAKKCELLASEALTKGDAGYRETDGPRAQTCRAVASFVRGAEAIGAWGARAEAERMDRARHNASMLGGSIFGGPMSAMVAAQRVDPPALARPVGTEIAAPHELVFAVEHFSRALALLEAHEQPVALRDELLENLED